MAPRDARATQARILDAARAEFAAHGLAGGRIERIAKSSDANVRMIYAYFGNKERLFDAVLVSAITELASTVPPTPDDLAGWTARLFDFHGTHPEVLRIAMWAQLERPESAAEPMQTYLAKADALAAAAPAPITAIDLLAILYAIAQAWYLTPRGLLAADGSDPDDPTRRLAHRTALQAAVHRIIGAPADW